MISPSQVQYILALKEYQSFQKAANACFITQPTLSMQIKKAEDVLGRPLFDRSKSPIELTSFGKYLLPTLIQIDDSYASLDIQLKKLKGTYKAEIKLGIIPTIAAYLIPSFYSEWQKELGDIKLDIIELKSEALIEAIEERKVDFGIMAGPLNTKNISENILYNEEILVYAPSIKNKEITTATLAKLKPWLLAEGNCLRTQMVNFCNLKNNDPKEWSYEGSSIPILLEMVKKFGGYTLVPYHFMEFCTLPKEDFHRVGNQTPVRQIIGIYHDKNAKEDYLKTMIRQIQRKKGGESKPFEYANLLAWR